MVLSKIPAESIKTCHTQAKNQHFVDISEKREEMWNFVYGVNEEWSDKTSQILPTLRSARMSIAARIVILIRIRIFITFERIDRFCSNFQCLFIWFFFIYSKHNNPRVCLPFKRSRILYNFCCQMMDNHIIFQKLSGSVEEDFRKCDFWGIFRRWKFLRSLDCCKKVTYFYIPNGICVLKSPNGHQNCLKN